MTKTISETSLDFQSNETFLTAIPAGTEWCVKAINADGKGIRLPYFFRSRFEALGAGILLAVRCKWKVVP